VSKKIAFSFDTWLSFNSLKKPAATKNVRNINLVTNLGAGSGPANAYLNCRTNSELAYVAAFGDSELITVVTTAIYGSHFFGIERFGSRQVFDGQHDESPKGWFGLVGELFVGLAGHIASTVPAQTKHQKTTQRDEKHGFLQSKTPVYYVFVKKSASDMYGKIRHFFGDFQHLSVLSRQFGLSFV
jgi:hypothetical protein